MVHCVGKSACRIVAIEWRCDLGYADRQWHCNLYRGGKGQWIAGADGVGARVDYGEHDAGDADGYVNESRNGTEWKHLQRGAEREWRNTGLHVVDRVWKFASRTF